MSKNLVECNTSTVPWFIALASTPTRYPRAGRGADGQARRVGSLLATLALGQQLWSFRHLPSVLPSSGTVLRMVDEYTCKSGPAKRSTIVDLSP